MAFQDLNRNWIDNVADKAIAIVSKKENSKGNQPNQPTKQPTNRLSN